jgi:hypothetical protein
MFPNRILYLILYLLVTKSMKQSPSWESNSLLDTQFPALRGTRRFITVFTNPHL